MLRYKESTASIERHPTVHVSVHRVVIGDSQPLMLEGIAQVLRSFGTTPVDRCCNGADLLQAILTHRPDLAIMDLRLTDPDGLAILRELKRHGLEIPVILMTGPLQDSEVLEAIQLGIRGLVAKDSPLSAMERCVRTVLDGGTWLDQALVGRAMSALLARETALREFGALLTAREMEVMILYFGLNDQQPHTLEEIGERFSLTRERVRQIKERATREMRMSFRSQGLRTYLS